MRYSNKDTHFGQISSRYSNWSCLCQVFWFRLRWSFRMYNNQGYVRCHNSGRKQNNKYKRQSCNVTRLRAHDKLENKSLTVLPHHFFLMWNYLIMFLNLTRSEGNYPPLQVWCCSTLFHNFRHFNQRGLQIPVSFQTALSLNCSQFFHYNCHFRL